MKYLLTLIIGASSYLNAQVHTPTWGVQDTMICFVKNTGFISVHGYLELYNNAGNDLTMNWVRQPITNWPAEWDAGFTDPDSFYVNVLAEDTAQFTLLNPVGFSNQLILNMEHNNHIDTGYLSFTVYPQLAPEDSLRVTFCVIITSPDAGLNSPDDSHFFFYNSLTKSIEFAQKEETDWNDLVIYDLQGRVVKSVKLAAEVNSFSAHDLFPGVYIIYLGDGKHWHRQKVTIF